MSGNGVTLSLLRDLIVTQGQQTDGRLRSIEAEVSTTRIEVVDQGKVLAQLQQTCARRGAGCAVRMRHQSDEIRRLGGSVEDVREDTGVLHQEDIKRRAIWWTLVKVAGALVALGGIAIGAVGAIQSCSTAREVKQDLKKSRAVKIKLLDQPWCLSELAEMRGVLERRLPHGEWMRLATEDVPWPRWR